MKFSKRYRFYDIFDSLAMRIFLQRFALNQIILTKIDKMFGAVSKNM